MRLIDADALNDVLIQKQYNAQSMGILYTEYPNMMGIVAKQPTIEAAPVVHGRWEDKPTGRYGQQQSWCSACRKHSGIGGIEKNRHRAYCPNCGARMDGDGNA